MSYLPSTAVPASRDVTKSPLRTAAGAGIAPTLGLITPTSVPAPATLPAPATPRTPATPRSVSFASTPGGASSGGTPRSLVDVSSLSVGESVLSINPFDRKMNPSQWDIFENYYKPTLLVYNDIIQSKRESIRSSAEVLRKITNPLAKIMIGQQIVEECSQLAYPLYVRSDIYPVISDGMFNTPSEFQDQYKRSKHYVFYTKVREFLDKLRSSHWIQKGAPHKAVLKQRVGDGSKVKSKSSLTPSSKTALDSSSSFSNTILAGAPSFAKLEEMYKETYFVYHTVYHILDKLADFNLSDILQTSLDKDTIEHDIGGSISSGTKTGNISGRSVGRPRSSSSPSKFSAMPPKPKEYAATVTGQVERVKDRYAHRGLEVGTALSKTKEDFMVTIPRADTKRLAQSSLQSLASTVTDYDTVKFPTYKRSRPFQSDGYRASDARPNAKRVCFTASARTPPSEYLTESTSGSPNVPADLSTFVSQMHQTDNMAERRRLRNLR